MATKYLYRWNFEADKRIQTFTEDQGKQGEIPCSILWQYSCHMPNGIVIFSHPQSGWAMEKWAASEESARSAFKGTPFYT
jgi:hypothetical protein